MKTSNTTPKKPDEYLIQFQLPSNDALLMNKIREHHFLSGTYIASGYRNSMSLYNEKHNNEITQNELNSKYKDPNQDLKTKKV